MALALALSFNYVNSPTIASSTLLLCACIVCRCRWKNELKIAFFIVFFQLSTNINKRFECFYWLLVWGSWFHAAKNIQKYSKPLQFLCNSMLTDKNNNFPPKKFVLKTRSIISIIVLTLLLAAFCVTYLL